MEGSSLTNEEIEAALQLIQLISSGSRRRGATVGKLELREEKEEEESEDVGSTAAAYASPPSPSSIEKILQRKRELLLSSTRARIRRRIRNEMKAAEQLLHLSEEEGEEGGGGGGGEGSGSNISEASYVTDASFAAAMESRADQDGESEPKQGGGSKSARRRLSSFYTEEGEGDFMEEECCLADVFCRRRKRKFRSLIDIYTTTNPLNGPRD